MDNVDDCISALAKIKSALDRYKRGEGTTFEFLQVVEDNTEIVPLIQEEV